MTCICGHQPEDHDGLFGACEGVTEGEPCRCVGYEPEKE